LKRTSDDIQNVSMLQQSLHVMSMENAWRNLLRMPASIFRARSSSENDVEAISVSDMSYPRVHLKIHDGKSRQICNLVRRVDTLAGRLSRRTNSFRGRLSRRIGNVARRVLRRADNIAGRPSRRVGKSAAPSRRHTCILAARLSKRVDNLVGMV
jgi:hypothetical protein